MAVASATSSTSASMIVFDDVDLRFPDGGGVFELNYNVAPGTIVGVIGPSGCGKTTTVRLALGLYQPTKGNIRVFGRKPSSFSATDRERIGYIPQQFVLYPTLSVSENAGFVASLYGMSRSAIRKRLDELLPFVDLVEARNRRGSQLSGGMQRRLMLVSALMHDPDLLFADEPTAGIDPVLRARFWDYFRSLRDQGHTLVVTTQYVGEASYCDYVAVMRKGRILRIDTPENLRRTVMGGEIIEMTFDASREYDALRALRRHPLVRYIRHIDINDDGNVILQVTVENAAEALPDLIGLLENSEGPNIEVISAARHEISYDDIFIRIMQEQEGKDG